ncbi:kynureninase [Klugiella xanthotipulae]|uniref:Kynureninase n=1 Tax=Klugiella xanthotipulae TaxID=244735 RepID=A0A543I6J5_9MICO|nr:kynureninase [Klugiella xanthotipulae]TQM66197.1 kynureninase [Klugiella xanthotipulae]
MTTASPFAVSASAGTAPLTREDCVAADAVNPLARFRDQFELPEGVLYFDGNSLGARPRGTAERAAEVITAEWGTDLVRSWNTAGWFDLPARLGDKLGRLIGAGDGEVVVTDSTTLNIFKALAAAVRIQKEDHPERRVIVTERDNFPTDVYITEGLIEFLDQGYELRLIDADLPWQEAITDDVVVSLLSHVNYRTGTMYNMEKVTAHAHANGVLTIWDLAHAAGAVDVQLAAAKADFAVGCTYKYLNGGPGSPAFIWVNAAHQDRFWQPLSGWWGHARPFEMETHYEPQAGIRRFLCGTQPIVSLALVECGLDVTVQTSPAELHRVSLDLTDLFIRLVEERCGDHPLTLITPRDHAVRGSHVSFEHPNGYQIIQALTARGVIGDYREPEVLRFGVTPLYLGYADVWDAVEILRDILDTRSWDAPEFHRRNAVT